jgi:hypothetical protein
MKPHLSRRKFLAAAGGSALVLPFLRALPGYAQTSEKKYLILLFSGNGRVRHTWGADLNGPETGNITLRSTFASLEPYKDYITVINGLYNKSADDIGGTHEGGVQSLWTGVTSAGGGPSVDQLVGPVLGGVRKSLEFRVMSNEDELNRTPNNRMIFDTNGVPMDPREDAASAVDQLFAGIGGTMVDPAVARNERIRAEVFGQLASELGTLKPRLCAEDQVHLEALRAGWDTVQKNLADAKMLECTRPNETSNSGNYFRDRSRSLIDVMVMSLACDLTRTASLQWSQGLSNLVASWAGISEKHHDISHAQPNHEGFIYQTPYPELAIKDDYDNPTAAQREQFGPVWDKLDVMNTFYAEEFAYLLQRLSSFPVAGGKTLLDQTLIAWGSEIDNGSSHDHLDMPFILAGGGGGRLKRGTVVTYPRGRNYGEEINKHPPGQRYHNDLLVTIAQILGADISSVGASIYNQGPLTELIV